MNRRTFLSTPFDIESPPNTKAEKHYIPIITKPTAGYPREHMRHTWVLVEDIHAWLCRDDLGFYAVDAMCPHLGGMIRPADKIFECSCHCSTFAVSGQPMSGPARRQLHFLRVDLDSSGKLVIQRDQVVSPDDRFIA